MSSLRARLSKRKKNTKCREATQVIYLHNIVEDPAKNSARKILAEKNSISWFERHQISGIKDNNVLALYKRVLKTLKKSISQNPSLPLRIQIKEALLSLYTSGSGEKNAFSRRTRKQIFRRLSSLFHDQEAFFNIVTEPEVKRAILIDRLNVRVHNKNGTVTSVPLFYCEEENEICRMLIDFSLENNGNGGVLVFEGTEYNILVERIFVDSENSGFVFKPHAKQGTNMLELIRAGILDPPLSRSLSRLVKEKKTGMILFGASNTGRSRLLSGLISTLSFQRIPLVIGNASRLRLTHGNAFNLDEKMVLDVLENKSADDFANSLSKMGVTDIFIDDLSLHMLPLLQLLAERYSIYPVITIRGSMHGAAKNFFSSAHLIEFACRYLSVVLDLGDIPDDCSLKGIHEMQNSNNTLKFITLAEKEEGLANWNLTGAACESSRYFDTIMIRQ